MTSTSGGDAATFVQIARCQIQYVKNAGEREPFLEVFWSSSTGFEIAWIESPGSVVRTITPTAGNELILEFDNLKWIIDWTDTPEEAWGMRVSWTASRVIVDGTTVSTWGAKSFECVGIAPAYCPWANPIQIWADGSTNSVSGTGGFEYTNETTFSGGYRFKEVGATDWSTHPVQLPPMPSVLEDIYDCTNSWECGGLWSRNLSSSDGEVFFTFLDRTPNLFVVPNLPQGTIKTGHDYGALVEGGAFPSASDLTYEMSGPWDASPPTPGPGEYVYGTVYDGESAWLANLTSADHAFESRYDQITYIMVQASVIDGTSNISGSVTGYEFPNWVQRPDEYLGEAAYLSFDDGENNFWTHTDALILSNTWHHRAWSAWFYGTDWNIDGGSTSFEDYWAPIGDQHGAHVSLPPEENSGKRNTLVSAGLLENAKMRNWFTAFVHAKPTGWHGWGRIEVDSPTYPATVSAEAGPDRWTLTGGSASWGGSSVTVTPSSTSVSIEYDLSSWVDAPFHYPALAKRFNLAWSGGTITDVQVVLIGDDDEEVTLSDNTQGWASWPLLGLNAIKYCGSWGHSDWGLGEITDDPDDNDAGGDSDATMLDTKLSTNVLRLPARSAARIRFDVTLSGTGSTFALTYPVFERPTAYSALAECRQYQSILASGASYVRFGAADFSLWNSGAIILPRGLGAKATALDWLTWRRYWLTAEDDSDVSTDLSAIYSDLDVSDTIAWPWTTSANEIVGIHTDTLQVPPLSGFAQRARDPDDLAETDAYTLQTYDWCERPRYHMSPTSVSPFVDSLGWLAPAAVTVSGWNIRSHSHAVDGTESGVQLSLSGIVAKDVRPWHGFLGVFGVWPPVGGGGIANCQTPWGYYVEARSTDSGITAGVAYRNHPVGGVFDVISTVSLDGDQPALTCSHRGDIDIYYHLSGSILWKRSQDHVATWTTASSVATGMHPRVGKDQAGNEWFAWFVPNSGTSGPGKVHVKSKAPGDAAFGSAVILSSTFADSGFDITAPHDRQMAWVLAATIDGDSDPTRYKSVDRGATWAVI